MKRQSRLPEIVDAVYPLGFGVAIAQRRQEHGGQEKHYANAAEQFDQRISQVALSQPSALNNCFHRASTSKTVIAPSSDGQF